MSTVGVSDEPDEGVQDTCHMIVETEANGGDIKMEELSLHDTRDTETPVRDRRVRRSVSCSHMESKQMMETNVDESYLIGRRLSASKSASREHSHIRITEVCPSNGAIVSGHNDNSSTQWKTPLQLFTDKHRGKTEEDKLLGKRIRSYYKQQDTLIKAFEEIQMENIDLDQTEALDATQQSRAEMLAKLSFGVNLILLIAKSVAVALSSSISIISSLVDSAVDLMSGVIIWWTSRAILKRNIYSYPGGRTRLEPVAIVVLSVIMSIASFQLIVESIQLIVAYSSKQGTMPNVQLPVILIAVGTIVFKFVLYLLCYCYGGKSSSVRALALDHRNDVLSNIVAIICGYLGSQEFSDKVHIYDVVYIDPIGAILISFYILFNWWKTGYEQTKLLTGFTADNNFLSKITWICLNHHQEIIYIDTVRAFHFGNNFLVEVDIVLPEEMSVRKSHNIGETLQQKLEKFELVERAFVHIDYEIEHHPQDEHKRL